MAWCRRRALNDPDVVAGVGQDAVVLSPLGAAATPIEQATIWSQRIYFFFFAELIVKGFDDAVGSTDIHGLNRQLIFGPRACIYPSAESFTQGHFSSTGLQPRNLSSNCNML